MDICVRQAEHPMNRSATFTLDELDLRRAARLHVFSSIREPRTIGRLLTIWIVTIVVLAAWFRATGMPWPELRDSLLLFALIAIAVILGVAVVFPLVFSPLAIRHRFRQDKLVSKPVSVRWDEEAYEAEQPGVHNRIPWRDYLKCREDRHLFVFFLSDYNYQVLPKRALTQEQIKDIQQTLFAR